MNEPKIYIPKCNAKEVTTRNGTLLKLSFRASDLAAFAREHQNQAGWLNLCVTKRQQPGQYGETHSVWLDTWKPKQSEQQPAEPAANQSTSSDGVVPF